MYPCPESCPTRHIHVAGAISCRILTCFHLAMSIHEFMPMPIVAADDACDVCGAEMASQAANPPLTSRHGKTSVAPPDVEGVTRMATPPSANYKAVLIALISSTPCSLSSSAPSAPSSLCSSSFPPPQECERTVHSRHVSSSLANACQ